MQERYKKNCGSFMTEGQQKILLSKTFAVIGVGGNGGYIAEFLARQGCKKLILVDFDKFETSNLNRQAFCFEDNLGRQKAEQAISQLRKINSTIEYECYLIPFGQIDIPSMQECDMIFYAADGNQYSTQCRKYLRDLILNGIPLVEQCVWDKGVKCGLITSQYIQRFDEKTASWEEMAKKSMVNISQPAWLCAFAASLAVAEAWKYFSDMECLIGQELVYDVYENMLHREVNGRFIY